MLTFRPFVCACLLLPAFVFAQADTASKPAAPAQAASSPYVVNGRLDLAKLTAPDGKEIADYELRRSIVSDSAFHLEQEIDQVREKVAESYAPLSPRGEFETAEEYEARKKQWEAGLEAKIAPALEPLRARHAQLVEAEQTIWRNRGALAGNLELRSVPKGAEVWAGNDSLGITPLKLKEIPPEPVEYVFKLEGHQPFHYIVAAEPGRSIDRQVELIENTIYPQTSEINISELLLTNTDDINEFERRLTVISARRERAIQEYADVRDGMRRDFKAPDPKGEYETAREYKKRVQAHQDEQKEALDELERKHRKYLEKLDKGAKILKDYIVASQATLLTLDVPAHLVQIDRYNPDKTSFGIVADYDRGQHRFHLSGGIPMPIDSAKKVSWDHENVKLTVQYYNLAFEQGGFTWYPAYAGAKVTNDGKTYPVNAVFHLPNELTQDPGYARIAAKQDSLSSGKLKPEGLNATDLKSAFNPVEALRPTNWKIPIAVALLAVGVGGVVWGLVENAAVDDAADISPYAPPSKYKKAKDDVDSHKTMRTVGYAVGGAGLLAGTLVFCF